MLGKNKKIVAVLLAMAVLTTEFCACSKPDEKFTTLGSSASLTTTSSFATTSKTDSDHSKNPSSQTQSSVSSTTNSITPSESTTSKTSPKTIITTSAIPQNNNGDGTTSKRNSASLISSKTVSKTWSFSSSFSSKNSSTQIKPSSSSSSQTSADSEVILPSQIDNATAFLNGLNQRERKIVEKISNAVKNFQTEISFNGQKVTQQQVNNALTIVSMINIEENYVSREYAMSIDEDTDYVVTLKLSYTKDRKQFLKEKSQLEQVANEIIENCNATTDYEVIKYLHDEIIKRCVYDAQSENSTTAYGCLVENKAVCEGYSKAFIYLCSKFGYECIPVVGVSSVSGGQPEGHMWNMVKLGDKWYNIDLTWDDPIMTSGNNYEDYVCYDYFLIDDQKIAGTHQIDPPDGFSYPVADDNTMEYYKVYGLSFATKDDAIDNIQKIVNNAVLNDKKYAYVQVTDSQEYENFKKYLFENTEYRKKAIFDILKTAKQQVGNENLADTRYSRIFNESNGIITIVLVYE